MCHDQLISMSTRTQLEHDATGGVVPEVAARSHANAIFPCIDEVLSESGVGLEEIDYFACTQKPWLLPSLLTGMTVAKTLALSLRRPILWIDHIEAHIFANLLERKIEDIEFPAVVLTVSGGHTEIYHWRSLFDLQIIWQTHDDAAGECFDKVSKMLGTGFPWGAKIAQMAVLYREKTGKSERDGIFPLVLLEKDSLDFSFSGLKSAVKRHIDSIDPLTDNQKEYISFEFEEVVTDILAQKLIRALEYTHSKSILLAGWVSANTLLKQKIQVLADLSWVPFLSPKKTLYSMDNAAMIGIRSYYELKKDD